MKITQILLLIPVFLLYSSLLKAEIPAPIAVDAGYQVQAGDILEITVWKEDNMQKDVIVRPDGMISFPLVGEISAKGKTLAAIQEIVTQRLTNFISEPVVTVAAKDLQSNKIYIIGKVNKPGEYSAVIKLDVLQALSMAGGLAPFAGADSIKIIRSNADGGQTEFSFKYSEVEDGENLQQNIRLQSGDVIVVP